MFDDICHVCRKCGELVSERIVGPCCDWAVDHGKKVLLACGCAVFVGHEVESLMAAPPPQMQTHTPEAESTDPANPSSSYGDVGTSTTTTSGPPVRAYTAYPPDDFPPYPGGVFQSRPPVPDPNEPDKGI